MAQCFPLLSLLLFFSLTRGVLTSVSARQHWWPPHGNVVKVKCPYQKVDLSWFKGTVNPCPGLQQPICGTNFVTYENPCILCVESLKSNGRIKFYYDGRC